MQELLLGKEKVSLLERCPHFSGVLREGCHCIPSPSLQTLRAMDRLSVEETRDLLVSVLFVLKHIESSVLLHWWSELIGSGGGSRASGKLSDFEDPSTSRLSQFFDFFNALE